MEQNGGMFKKKKVKFAQVSNLALRDENLSLKAKGLYSMIQSYITIENFTLYKNTLIKQCKDKEGSFNTAWKELKDNGYLVQEKKRTSNGSFYYEYDLLDEPFTTPQFSTPGFSTLGSSTPGSSTPGKMGVYNNTDFNNTDLSNTDLSNNENSSATEKVKKLIYMDLTFIEDYIDTVKITQDQYDKLVKDYGVNIVNNTIRNLDNYIVNNKRKYKDHNRVLRTWLSKNNNQNGKEHLKRKDIPSFNANTNQKESINHNQGYGF